MGAKEDLVQLIINTSTEFWCDNSPMKFRDIPQMSEAVVKALTTRGQNFLFTEVGDVLRIQETEFRDAFEDCDAYSVWVNKEEN